MKIIIIACLMCAIVIALYYKGYRVECEDIEADIREEEREEIAARNAVIDAAWRDQLDREQLFREYVKWRDAV